MTSIASSALRRGEGLPLLHPSPAPGELVASRTAERVTLGVDGFSGCFLRLSRYEELVVPARDAYGRFPATASIAHREGFLKLPLADAYLEVLWRALAHLWPRFGAQGSLLPSRR